MSSRSGLDGFLARVGARQPEATPAELLDALWMARKASGGLAREASLAGPEEQADRPSADQSPAAGGERAVVELHGQQPAGGGEPVSQSPGLSTRLELVDEGRLPRSLAWLRALHRLARWERSGPMRIDLAETVQHTAGSGQLSLVFQPSWQAVGHLVVAEARALSMEPWKADIGRLAALARRSGRFASVSHVVVDAVEDEPALEIPDSPGQQVLVLWVSDGLAPGQDEALFTLVRSCTGKVRVAWLHPWGEARWYRTPLRSMQPTTPGVVRAGQRPDGAVLGWEPSALARLEGFTSGRRSKDLRGVHLRWPVARSTSAESEPDWEYRAARLERLLAPGALQVLGLAAAVPGRVDLPLLQALARNHPVPATRVDLAEAITSGFLERAERDGSAQAGQIALRFRAKQARRVALGWLARAAIEPTLRGLLRELRRGPPDRASALAIPVDFVARMLDRGAASTLPPQAEAAEVLSMVVELGELDVADWVRAALGEAAAAAAVRAVAEPAPGTILHTAMPDSAPLPLAYILAGSFLMGSPDGLGGPDEHPRHRVRLSQPFLLGVTPVTQAQWRAVVQASGAELDPSPSRFEGGDRPVEQVSWRDCVQWCNLLSQLEGRSPAYRLKGEHDAELVSGADGYRLPTEAQWEYACRAGTEAAWSFGDDATRLKDHGWCKDNSERSTHRVGELRPNPWGLYDVHGNVWEWCQDWWKRDYSAEEVMDPAGPARGGGRVVRGGSYVFSAVWCRSAFRNYWRPGFRVDLQGFRVLLPAAAPSLDH